MDPISFYNLIVTAVMATVLYCAGLSFLELRRIARLFREIEGYFQRCSRLIGSTKFEETLGRLPEKHGARAIIGPLLIAQGDEADWDEEAIWGRTENDHLAPVMARASGLAAAAPCLGLLITALSISLGLTGGGGVMAVAERLTGALPAAFLSTVAAMAATVALTMRIAATSAQWHQMRGAYGAFIDSYRVRSRRARGATALRRAS